MDESLKKLNYEKKAVDIAIQDKRRGDGEQISIAHKFNRRMINETIESNKRFKQRSLEERKASIPSGEEIVNDLNKTIIRGTSIHISMSEEQYQQIFGGK